MNSPLTVLLVDDEVHVRLYVSLVLRQLGDFRIFEAPNGRVALDLYTQHRPDLVLLDVNMPELDGLGTLRELRTRDPDALVIMLTSLTNRQTVEECVALGAYNYLRKDVTKAELQAALRETFAACFSAADETPAPTP